MMRCGIFSPTSPWNRCCRCFWRPKTRTNARHPEKVPAVSRKIVWNPPFALRGVAGDNAARTRKKG
jgi:hypothetical protein